VNLRRHLLEAATLLLLAILCALVANALASRERKLALVGNYPDALKVPEKKTGEKTGDSSASHSGAIGSPGPVDAGAEAPSEVSSKVNEAEAAAPAPLASTAGATASGKLPFEEKHPGPREKSAPKATSAASASSKLPFEEKRPGPATGSAPNATPVAAGSEAGISSSSPDDLLKRFPPHNKPYVEIPGDDAAWLVAHGALVLDARRTKDYEQGHIARARSFPVWESDIDSRVTALVGEGRDGAIPVVLYCSGGDCEDSHMLAQKLFGAGFNNLLVYRDGWPDWVKRGGRSARGPAS
jgi:rhodanese-related sulfurtransferase